MKSRYYFQSSWVLHFNNAPHYRTLIRSLLLEYCDDLRKQFGFQIFRYSCGQGLHCIWGSAPDSQSFSTALAHINSELSQWINRKGRFSAPLSERQAFSFDIEPLPEKPVYESRRSLVGTPNWIRFQRRERYLEFLKRKITACPASI